MEEDNDSPLMDTNYESAERGWMFLCACQKLAKHFMSSENVVLTRVFEMMRRGVNFDPWIKMLDGYLRQIRLD